MLRWLGAGDKSRCARGGKTATSSAVPYRRVVLSSAYPDRTAGLRTFGKSAAPSAAIPGRCAQAWMNQNITFIAYADFASVPTLTTRSRGVPSDTTRSAGAGDVQAKPPYDQLRLATVVAESAHWARDSKVWPREVGRTDLLAATSLCQSCLRGPQTLGAWLWVKERCIYLDPSPSRGLPLAACQARCGNR